MVIFHSYGTVYQRVSWAKISDVSTNCWLVSSGWRVEVGADFFMLCMLLWHTGNLLQCGALLTTEWASITALITRVNLGRGWQKGTVVFQSINGVFNGLIVDRWWKKYTKARCWSPNIRFVDFPAISGIFGRVHSLFHGAALAGCVSWRSQVDKCWSISCSSPIYV